MNQSKNNTELHFDALPDILTVQQTRGNRPHSSIPASGKREDPLLPDWKRL